MVNEQVLFSLSLNKLEPIMKNWIRQAVRECLQDIPQGKAPSNKQGVKETAAQTGYSPNTIYKLVHERKIPFHKPAHGGSKLIFHRDEIEEWMSERTPESPFEYCDRKEEELYNTKKGLNDEK